MMSRIMRCGSKFSTAVSASFRQEWEHHDGTTESPNGFSASDVRKVLGCSLDEVPDRVSEGKLLLAAIEPDGRVNYDMTAYDAKGTGFWFNPQGQVTRYGNNSSVYVELSYYGWEFILGKHPSLCQPGRYNVSVAVVVPTSGDAVQIDFHIEVTE